MVVSPFESLQLGYCQSDIPLLTATAHPARNLVQMPSSTVADGANNRDKCDAPEPAVPRWRSCIHERC
jgi:hypothetical protein